MRYRVNGVANSTGEPTEIVVEARDSAHALRIANAKGLAVNGVTALDAPKPKTDWRVPLVILGVLTLMCLFGMWLPKSPKATPQRTSIATVEGPRMAGFARVPETANAHREYGSTQGLPEGVRIRDWKLGRRTPTRDGETIHANVLVANDRDGAIETGIAVQFLDSGRTVVWRPVEAGHRVVFPPGEHFYEFMYTVPAAESARVSEVQALTWTP